MRRLLPLLLAAVLLAGCVGSPTKNMQAVELAYRAAVTAERTYTARPDADPASVARLLALDDRAYAALESARAARDAGLPSQAAASLAASSALTFYANNPETRP